MTLIATYLRLFVTKQHFPQAQNLEGLRPQEENSTLASGNPLRLSEGHSGGQRGVGLTFWYEAVLTKGQHAGHWRSHSPCPVLSCSSLLPAPRPKRLRGDDLRTARTSGTLCGHCCDSEPIPVTQGTRPPNS